MLEFITNYGGSVAVGTVVLAIVALIVAKGIKDKRAGKCSCGGNCGGCGGCSGCGSAKENPKKAGVER